MKHFRLRNRRVDLSDFCTHLNWSQNTRFSYLSGALPFPTLSSLELSSSSSLSSSQEVRGLGTNGLLNRGQNQCEVFRNCIYDFSNLSGYGSKVQGSRPRNRNRYFVQRNVTRGLGLDEARRLEMYFASSTGLESPVLQRYIRLFVCLSFLFSFFNHSLHSHSSKNSKKHSNHTATKEEMWN